ncbi:MAG: tandem-95 repeat protein [Helicobacteraceae bacterium]|nr:tandem-95 repeat protein [Helicobacteraceae bacterium]
MKFLKFILFVLLVSRSLFGEVTVSSQIGSLSGISSSNGSKSILFASTQNGGVYSSGSMQVYASILGLGSGNISFDSSNTAEVYENQNSAITVKSTNKVANDVNYTISGGADSANFEINATSGELTFTANPDYETKKSYEVVVKATDVVTSEIASQLIVVNIANVNDVAPTFENSGATVATENTQYTYAPTTNDVDSDLTSVSTDLPDWLGLGVASGSGEITVFAGTGLKGKVVEGSATSSPFQAPRGTAIDSNGNIYVVDSSNKQVLKVDTNGNISVFAGTGSFGDSGDEGAATDATFWYPTQIAVDKNDNVYIADNRVRKVTPDGVIHAFAGDGSSGYSGDGGAATSATFKTLSGMAIDDAKNMYIADYGNHVIRKVATDGTISTVVGNGVGGYSGDGGAATSAQLRYPKSVALDSEGNLYIADSSNYVIRKVATDGTISTIAGIANISGTSGDGGAASEAIIGFVSDIAVDASNNIFISMPYEHVVRKIDTNGIITTVVGTGERGYTHEDILATQAKLAMPYNVSVALDGSLYITDSATYYVKKVSPIEMAIVGTPTVSGVYDVNLSVTDGKFNATQNYQITVANVNDAPTLESHAFVVSEGAKIGDSVGFVQAYDEDGVAPSLAISGGEVISYAIESGDTNSDLSINSSTGEITTAKLLEHNTTQSYNLVVSATDDDTATASNYVFITVTDVNNTPIAVADSITIDEDNNATIYLTANDTDLDSNINSSSVVITQEPTYGSVEVNASGVATFVPNENYFGSDYFTYKMYDFTSLESNEANVSITINAVNDTPVATSSVLHTHEDVDISQQLFMFVSDSDGIADISSYVIDSTTTNGSLVLSDGAVTYDPDANFYGFDTFTFHAVDGNTTTSNSATITINVADVNDIPVANNDDATTDEDVVVVIKALENDSDDGGLDASSISILKQPSHGSVEIIDGNFSYTPDLNWYGNDKFSYTVQDDGLNTGGAGSDGALVSNEGVVSVTVTSVNDAPTAVTDTLSVPEDSFGVFTLHTNDTDIDDDLNASAITLVTQPSNGVINLLDNGLFIYVAQKDYFGVDSFTYKISDADVNSSVVTSNIVVTSVNDVPVFLTTETLSVSENNSTAFIILSGKDIENDTLSYELNTTTYDGSYFSLNRASGELSFSSEMDYEDPQDSDTDNTYNVSLNIIDSNGGMSSKLFNVSVTDINNVSDDEDGNGISDNDENSPTLDNDGDGVLNHQDSDNDGDGILDSTEGATDYDEDGIPDYKDSDSDNDGIADIDEGSADSDGDGFADYKDFILKTDLSDYYVTINDTNLVFDINITTNGANLGSVVVTPQSTSTLIHSSSVLSTNTVTGVSYIATVQLSFVPKANVVGLEDITISTFDGVDTLKETFQIRVGGVIQQYFADSNGPTSNTPTAGAETTTNIYYDEFGTAYESNITTPNGATTNSNGDGNLSIVFTPNPDVTSGGSVGADINITSLEPYESNVSYEVNGVVKAKVSVENPNSNYDFDENGTLSIDTKSINEDNEEVTTTLSIKAPDSNITSTLSVNGKTTTTDFNMPDTNTTIDIYGNVVITGVATSGACSGVKYTTSSRNDGSQIFTLTRLSDNNTTRVFIATAGSYTNVDANGTIFNKVHFTQESIEYKIETTILCDGSIDAKEYIKTSSDPDVWALTGTQSVAVAGTYGALNINGRMIVSSTPTNDATSYSIDIVDDEGNVVRTSAGSFTTFVPTIKSNDYGAMSASSQDSSGNTLFAQTEPNGQTKHTITVGSVITQATSRLEGATTQLRDSGITTKLNSIAINADGSGETIDMNVSALSNGKAVHYLKYGTNVVQATSNIVGAKSIISRDDSAKPYMMTWVSLLNDLNQKVNIEVTAKSDATAIHKMSFTDETATQRVIQANFSSTTVSTIINTDGSIETNSSLLIGDVNVTYKSVATLDGTTRNFIYYEDPSTLENVTTRIVSQLRGGSTTLDSVGNMETNITLESDSNIKVIINTLPNAKSTIKFNNNGVIHKVLSDNVYYAADTNLTLQDNGDGRIKVQAIIPLTENIKF